MTGGGIFVIFVIVLLVAARLFLRSERRLPVPEHDGTDRSDIMPRSRGARFRKSATARGVAE